ncbi:TPA: pilus/toxin transcriptional regulator ToxT, partial [Vibrio cholerae]|nr:pilus/toxin transcriptional regulator ToxT [Vibrio cholerae]ELS0595037.1 pilus/toxin transcriptional regulator ToxT [Vibrio cholerae]HAS7089617.1 pilus/toxin transcriptional regulator ToxT [Vibrio cholerae]
IDSGIAKLIDKNCLVSYEINSSSIILLKKNSIQRFSLTSLSDENINVSVITISDSFIRSLKSYILGDLMIRNLYSENKDLLLWNCEHNDIAVLSEVVNGFREINYSDEFLKVFFSGFFSKVEKKYNSIFITDDLDAMEKISCLVKSDITRNWRWADICGELRTNRMILKKELESRGVKFRELINSIRISYSISLMKTGEFKIKQIAYQSGFASVSYFSTVFKSTMNVAPSEYLFMLTGVAEK